MALDAVLFDLDGTLVNANSLHARAWHRAMKEHGYAVGVDRIAIEIGKGGSMLVPAVLGREAEQKHGDSLREAHDAHFLELVDEEGVRAFPGVRDLFADLHARGLKTAIATASKQQNLEKVMEAAHLDLHELADVVVTDTDVERSKPHPDVVEAAVEKLGMSPAQCVMIGDTPYDVESAFRAGVTCLGLLTGVHDAPTLDRAGARAVYRDLPDLRAHLDDALRKASPGAAHLTHAQMRQLMDLALEEARIALEAGNIPVGSVLAAGDGTVLARGHSRTESSGNFLRHGEMVAFEQAAGQVPQHRHELILVSTLEPCVMCYGAAMEARVDTILYALHAPSNGGVSRCTPMRSPGMIMPRVVGGIGADESRALFASWLERNPGSPFVRQLLATV